MKSKRTETGWRRIGAGAAALGLAATCAWGGIAAPLYVGNLAPVQDQYGRKMIGSHLPSGAATRSYVEIRSAADGVIRPPGPDGAPHPLNPLYSTNSIGGMGMNSAEANSGIFCFAFAHRPAAGTKIFARAYNAPSVAEASFYADSAVGSAPATGSSLVLNFGPAQPLDAGDADVDGLNNAWEKALGIDDRATADYDGDGMGDYHEMLAGTGADDPNSLLAFRSIRREAGAAPADAGGQTFKAVRVKWQTVPGKSYQVQYVPSLLDAPVFIDVGEVVTAAAGEYERELLVDVPEGAVTGAFRIQLIAR
jgi:hypothetical protein